MKISRPIKGVRVVDLTEDTPSVFSRLEERMRIRERLKKELNKEMTIEQKEKLYEVKIRFMKDLEESFSKKLYEAD